MVIEQADSPAWATHLRANVDASEFPLTVGRRYRIAVVLEHPGFPLGEPGPRDERVGLDWVVMSETVALEAIDSEGEGDAESGLVRAAGALGREPGDLALEFWATPQVGGRCRIALTLYLRLDTDEPIRELYHRTDLELPAVRGERAGA